MESLIESSTYRTLHAHNFSRSSSQAAFVLSDLLARYLFLLTSSCAKYAQHSGRMNLTIQDALSALEEMGIDMKELSDYCRTEGRELGRYTIQTMRRMEDLKDIRASLKEGLRQDRDDAIPLAYAPLPETPPSSDDEAEAGESDTEMAVDDEPMSVDPTPSRSERQFSHMLPPSPVSIPPSPARKRPRTEWNTPAHIPDFLPPFPVPKEHSEPSSPENTPVALPTLLRTQEALSPLPQVSTTTSSADYLTPVPYTSSSLSSTPVWHLPQPPASFDLPSQPPRLATPQIQPSLLGAYHHILTNPPPSHGNAGNPARHRVALALLAQTENNTRWEPADTLFGLSSPNAPRVSTMPPSHPIAKQPPINASGDPGKLDVKGEEINKIPLPSVSHFPVTAQEYIAPSMSTQGSRLPEVARSVLPPPVYHRTTRLPHPPPLKRGTELLKYGRPVEAPWNSTNNPTQQQPANKDKKTVETLQNGKIKEEMPPSLPDAQFWATWDFEHKNFREPLSFKKRMGGVVQSSGGINLNPRVRVDSKFS
ncbi:hypothetical protein BDM02DRAFT_3142121 [Thelephora ganbajun]|uniref:Uncharacterized protein n=1 Tax=Thelephora ganbajun TaxID=370292 RepID=A0ACB6ZK38_THEGA|nr:hypothetical protein BDM02DRAFT_3142121 [Thelephora ganbajun]